MKMKKVLLLSFLSLFLLVNTGLAAAAPIPGSKEASITSITTSQTDAISLADPGTAGLLRGPVTIDWAKTRLMVYPGSPTRAYLNLVGSLPDPCHKLAYSINVSQSTGVTASPASINITAYSLYDPNVVCVTVIQPFSVIIPLGSFTSGTYIVVVNGVKVGSFSVISARTSSG